MLKEKIYIACLACCLGTAAWSQKEFNPIIPDNLADPSVVKFGDTFYLYGTTDIDQGLSKAGTPVVWKSKDFVNWSFDGSHIEGFDWKQGYPYTDTKGEHTGYFRYWAPGLRTLSSPRTLTENRSSMMTAGRICSGDVVTLRVCRPTGCIWKGGR